MPRKKSPPYPYFDIGKSLDYAKKLSSEIGYTGIPVQLGMKKLGLNPNSSTSRRAITSMLSYGLLDDVGGAGLDKKVKLSELSRRIILDKRLRSVERTAAIREATLNDDMMRRAWEEWKYDLPKDDSAIEYTLRVEWDFGDRAATRFVSVIRENYRYAVLDDYFESTDGDLAVPVESLGSEMQNQETIQRIPSDMKEISLPLSGGDKLVQLRIPSSLSEEEFDDLMTMMKILKVGLVKKEDQNDGQ